VNFFGGLGFPPGGIVFLSGIANPQNFQVSTTFAGFTWHKSVIFIKKWRLTPSDPLKMCGFSFFYLLKMRNWLLKTYLFVGGMPAALNEYLKSGDFGKVRKVQNGISLTTLGRERIGDVTGSLSLICCKSTCYVYKLGYRTGKPTSGKDVNLY
jgi:hypothetical protein